MKQYRGYYIDGATFNSKAEIDDFIKRSKLRKYRITQELFDENLAKKQYGMAYAAAAECLEIAKFLVTNCGMNWEDFDE